MPKTGKNVWKQISRIFSPNKEQSELGAQLFREYADKRFLSRPTPELLTLERPVIADFFRRAALMHSLESPILRRRDTRWMSQLDYTLVNIRAAGADRRPGTFLTAAIFLTTLRSAGIVLAPFTQGFYEDLELIDSHAVLRKELADPLAEDKGIRSEMQFKAFCEAAHLLDLVIGSELDYHVDPYAAVVLNKPEFFLWTHEGNFPADERVQDKLRSQVKDHLNTLRQNATVPQHRDFQTVLEQAALAPRLSDDGSGRTYLALKEGSDEHQALHYWGKVFNRWQEHYGFDFVVFRGTGTLNNNETPDLPLISKAADTARRAGVRRNTGVAAEGKAEEVEQFGIHGIDMVVENNAACKTDSAWFQQVFDLNDQLHRINLGRKLRFSVPLEIDPGDTQNSSCRQQALIKRFVARFLSAGPARRPLLETMGAMEGAWGYHPSRKHALGLGWMPSETDAALNRHIEDIADEYKGLLHSGECVEKHLDERCAWWIIQSKCGLLIAVVSVENDKELPTEAIHIDYAPYITSNKTMTVLEFDFTDNRGTLRLSYGTHLVADSVPYQGFRLYSVV